jgi:hypothetical protein
MGRYHCYCGEITPDGDPDGDPNYGLYWSEANWYAFRTKCAEKLDELMAAAATGHQNEWLAEIAGSYGTQVDQIEFVIRTVEMQCRLDQQVFHCPACGRLYLQKKWGEAGSTEYIQKNFRPNKEDDC